jgi:hypothetical protein
VRLPRLILALGATLLLALPAGASAAGFGPTSPLTTTEPFASQPVFASVFDSNTLRVTRVFTDGRPAKTVDVDTPTGNIGTNLHVATNPRGDALVTWTENGGANHLAVALFWPTGAPTPNAAHELLSMPQGAYGPWGVLDPDGSATVVWYSAEIWQVTTANAGAADPWGEPTADLGRGGGVGAQLPDGRAVYGITEEVQVTAPTPGHNRFWRVHATTRTEGHPFRPVASLAGGAGAAPATPPVRFPMERLPAVAISPAGRWLVAYITTMNGDDDSVCDPYEREVHAALGSVVAGTTPPAFTQSLVSTPDPDPYELTGARAGPDDRLAVVWHEQLGCWNASGRPQRHVAAYTVPGQVGMTGTGPGIPGPPATFRSFWWLADGRLLFWTQTTSPFANSQTIFDTGVPVTDVPDDGEPSGGGPSGGTVPISTPGPSTGGPPPPVVTVPRIRTVFKASANGTVRVTVTASGPGDLAIELLARRSGLISAKKTLRVRRYKRKVTKAGAVKLTLKLSGKAKKTLKQRHKLKITVVTVFKPAGGGKTLRSTKPVTFKLKR